MALTLAQIRTAMTEYAVYLDSASAAVSGVAVTTTEQTRWINAAIRAIARYCKLFDPRITFTIGSGTALSSTNNTTYNIRDISTPTVSKKVLKPYQVFISGSPLYDWNGKPGLWSYPQMEERRPQWRTESNSTPQMAVYLGGPRLLLVPGPSAAGSNNFIAGTYIPADLVVTTDDANYPDIGIVEELHECIAYYAALHAAMPTATEDEQWQRIAAYRSEWMEVANDIQAQNENAIEGSWDCGANHYSRFISV